MSRQLLINDAEPEETRVAVVGAGGRLEEFRHDRATSATLVGNLYLGRVVNLETGIGAAFVDIGVGRNAFLHVSDCPGAADDARIEDHAALGKSVLVQVTRDSIGSKGPVLTAQVSLPGRFVVLLPGGAAGGVSRRISPKEDRTKLRSMANQLSGTLGMGLILRTAAADRDEAEVERDARRIMQLWRGIEERARHASTVPARLYAETDLVARALRDMVGPDVDAIVVDTPEALERAAEIIAGSQPGLADRLRLHESAVPLFHAEGIEGEIDRLHARRVALPGGGSIVFDSTEALVAVDVNSGRTRTDEGLEETALTTNLEAATEIARQLRLRDLGGVVVVDFIDMQMASHTQDVDRRFREELRRDRSHLRTGRLGPFGIFVLTRQRHGDGAGGSHRSCPRCGGSGQVIRSDEVALRVWREIIAQAAGGGRGDLVARVSPEVAESLLRTRTQALKAVAGETGREIDVAADAALRTDVWRVETAS